MNIPIEALKPIGAPETGQQPTRFSGFSCSHSFPLNDLPLPKGEVWQGAVNGFSPLGIFDLASADGKISIHLDRLANKTWRSSMW